MHSDLPLCSNLKNRLQRNIDGSWGRVWDPEEPTVAGTSMVAAGVKEAVGPGCGVKAEPTVFANRLERHRAESRRLP